MGNLNYLRIWHDNTGEGQFASWYMNFIVFRDIQTGEKYQFICNDWFAVEKGDGLVITTSSSFLFYYHVIC
jgi:hypothetical protein